jgi:hypothetical protein
MGNISNTRFPFGLTNVNDVNLFADMVQPDPTLFHQYFQDFDTYVAGDWTVTETDPAATQALTAGDGGLLLVTNTAADNDLVALQKNPAAWSFTAGKKTFFRCRFKVSNATESDLVFGLQIVDTTPLDVTDGVYFLKADGSTNVAIVARKNATTGSTTATAITTMADNTFIELGWCYDGQSTIAYEVNGTVLGSLDGSSSYLPDANCTVSFALQNGNAVARTMTVDYIFVAKER